MFQSLTRYVMVGAALTAFACSQAACASDTEEPETASEANQPIVGGKISANGAWPGAVHDMSGVARTCGFWAWRDSKPGSAEASARATSTM